MNPNGWQAFPSFKKKGFSELMVDAMKLHTRKEQTWGQLEQEWEGQRRTADLWIHTHSALYFSIIIFFKLTVFVPVGCFLIFLVDQWAHFEHPVFIHFVFLFFKN